MQNLNQLKNSFTWRPASKFIQFAFEQGGLRPFGRQDGDQENLENASPRRPQKTEEAEGESAEMSYQPSNQVIDFEKAGGCNQTIEISVTGIHVVDEVYHTNVFASKAFLPTFSISLRPEQAPSTDSAAQKHKYVELFLAQKSHNSEYEKYKIIKGGLRGTTKQKIKSDTVKLDKIRLAYLSNPEKLPRLILVVYEQAENHRTYRTIMISEEFSVIDNHKLLHIENLEQLGQYFEPILLHFLDKTGVQMCKINILSRHKVIEEMSTFENYLIKKNKKIWNIVYAAYKYSHIVDLYFYNPENKSKKEQFLELWKEVIEALKGDEVDTGERVCNHLDPAAKFVLKIHAPMRNVRFFLNKSLTKYLSILASQGQFQCKEKWEKFEFINELKEAYTFCHTEIQAKMISEPIITKPLPTPILANQPQVPIQQPTTPLPQILQTIKKASNPGSSTLQAPLVTPTLPQAGSSAPNHHGATSKNDDDDFNEEDAQDEDDDVEYDGQSSENYSVSNRKRGRKLGQKKSGDVKKSKDIHGRDNKCTTRGGNRVRNKEDTEDSNQKRALMAKKKKEKEAMFNNRAMPTSAIGNPPFRILTPAQAGQYKDQQTQSMEGKMIGIVMNPNGTTGMINPGAAGMINPGAVGMINPATGMLMKKPEDPKNPQVARTQPVNSVPKGVVPVMMPGMNPQMMAIMGNGLQGGMSGMQMMPMGNGMQAVMMPMPMSMDKQPGQTGMPAMMGMGGIPGAPGMGGMGGMGGISVMGGMQGMNGMMPFMMGNGGPGSNMPQGFMMPAMMGQQNQAANDKAKQANDQQDKQKQQQEKKDEKKDTFPPQSMPGLDFSKMAMMGGAQMPGGMSFMPGQMGGMQMPQQQMGMVMPSMGMMGSSGMPQGIMMNPMMAMQKQHSENKEDQAQKNPPQGSMQNPMMNGGMPFMVQMASQMQGSEPQGQNPMGMMGQFPGMMQMPQNSQMVSNPSQGQGMPMGYTMVMNPDQARSMTPAQMQQMQMQMQMMMQKGMMPMMQMPKPDNNDQNKK